MDELVKGFRRFIYRDALYILGGTLVLAAISYRLGCTECLKPHARPVYFLVIAAGVAYVVGHVVAEVLLVLRITNSGYFDSKSFFFRNIVMPFYRFYTREDFVFPPNYTHENYSRVFGKVASERQKERTDRITTLISISTTMGSNLLVVALLIIWDDHAIIESRITVWTLLVVALLLCFLSWLRSAQRGRVYVAEVSECGEHKAAPNQASHGDG